MKKISCLILLAGLIFGINSCHNSIIEEDIESLKSNGQSKLLIESAKDWFEANPSLNEFAVLDVAGELRWNKGLVHDVDTAIFIEVPLKLTEKYILEVKDDGCLNVEQRILFKIKDDNITSYLELITSVDPKEKIENIKKINYVDQEDLNGSILVVNVRGEVLSYQDYLSSEETEVSVEITLKSMSYLKC